MNKKDIHPDYKKIYEFARARFERTKHFKHGPYDESFFTLRVYESAKDIMRKLNKKVNVPLVLVSALLHDIGKSGLDSKKLFVKGHNEEWFRHAMLSVPIARKFLISLGHSPEFVESVCYLVLNHDKRALAMKSRTLELEILQDADLISDCGVAAFIRPFLHSGKYGRSIIAAIEYIQKEENRVLKKGFLNLDVSKKMAKEKIKVERWLIKEISKDIESDLL